ncbi:MAG: thiamine phosphate synthase [Anaerolineae bacterium]|nr:thiamine phosphate synthase [Gloeobacterales cyanobacterium ES-bin-313]
MISVPANGVLKILDANLDRVREGLRVIEEWLRFGEANLDQAALCKTMRQEIATFHTEAMHQARNTPGDPLTSVDHPHEVERLDVADVLRVNFARLQEGLRVIEEYAKLIDPQLAGAAKQWRYQIYTLESACLGDTLRNRLAPLYLVTSPHPNLLKIVEASLRGGLRLVQLRDKEAEGREIFDLACKLRDLCNRYDALLIVNDRVDLALASHADGVHLGQADLPITEARKLLGPHRLIGQSTHNPAEAAQSLLDRADYIGIGPVFATPTKPGRIAVGFDYVDHCRNMPIPGYAIGGIDSDNLEAVLSAGAKRVAVVRAIMAASDPERTTAELLEKLHA